MNKVDYSHFENDWDECIVPNENWIPDLFCWLPGDCSLLDLPR
jgi:hypothetical protein